MGLPHKFHPATLIATNGADLTGSRARVLHHDRLEWLTASRM
jgi:hypothetical protein